MTSRISGISVGKATGTAAHFPLLFVAAALIISGCMAAAATDAPNSDGLPVEKIWQGSQCGCQASQPVAVWVADQNNLEALAQNYRLHALEAVMAQRRPDWNREALVLIHMGLKPTGGFALELAEPVAPVYRDTAVITLQWRHPGPGSIVTQQITSPCLVLKLAKGTYGAIEIRDETGRVRVRLSLGI